MHLTRWTLLFAALTLPGCVIDSVPQDGDSGSTPNPSTANAGWTASWSPCSGSLVDALHCDDPQTCYVGCGSNASGQGLYRTTDGGLSWDIAPDETGTFFEDFRVHDLDRSPADGRLYVAGKGSDAFRVVALDTTDGTLEEVYNNHPNIDYSMSVGNYARRSDGLEIAESLTGGQVAIRKEDPAFRKTYAEYGGWANGAGWPSQTAYPSNGQVLDLAVVDDQILGVGSQINVPPAVLLPPRNWTFATDSDGDGSLDQLWETVSLSPEGLGAWDGECWGIDGNADGLAVVCVDQDADRGMVYTIGPDWPTEGYDRANWTETSFDTVVAAATVGGRSTWNEGVCRGPDQRVTVVGRDSQTNDGYIAQSDDGGVGWREVTEAVEVAFGGTLGPVTRCMYTESHLMVAGPGLYAFVAIDAL